MTEHKVITGLKQALAHSAQKIYCDRTRAQAYALFSCLAQGYALCHNRVDAEAVIIERMSAYKRGDAPEAVIPLAGCDFTGEIGNIIVALSQRCALAEDQRDQALLTIQALTTGAPK